VIGLIVAVAATSGCSKGATSTDRGLEKPVKAISRVVFAEDRLWLLQDDGRLASLDPNEGEPQPERVPGKVLDICKSAGRLTALVGDGAGRWALQQRSGEDWTPQASVRSKGDTLIAVACRDDSDQVTLVTNRRLVELTGGKSQSINLKRPLEEPFGVGTALATDDAVWLGLNAGEWGGGLRRVALKNGSVEAASKDGSGDFCGGPLNMACDPVNGIVPSPWKAGCLVVAVGMVHFISHGRIVQVCDNEVSRIYFKALDPQPPYGKVQDGEPSSTIAFFGLARTGNTVWALGIDGLYRFDRPQEPQFRTLPRFEKRGGYWVSFEIPGIALVLTDINQRRSMSGSVPIMAVR